MRKYLEAYLDVVGSGLIKKEVVLNHIEQHATIDKILPDCRLLCCSCEDPAAWRPGTEVALGLAAVFQFFI